MASVIIFDELDGKVLQFLKSAHSPDYVDRTDALINPDLSSVEAIPRHYWIVDLKLKIVREMSDPEKAAVDADRAAEREKGLARERVNKGMRMVQDLNVALVRARIGDEARKDIISSMHDVLILLMSGQLVKAKEAAELLGPTADIRSVDIAVVKDFINREIV